MQSQTLDHLAKPLHYHFVISKLEEGKAKAGKQVVDNSASGKITSRHGGTAVCQSVQPRQKTESVGDNFSQHSLWRWWPIDCLKCVPSLSCFVYPLSIYTRKLRARGLILKENTSSPDEMESVWLNSP